MCNYFSVIYLLYELKIGTLADREVGYICTVGISFELKDVEMVKGAKRTTIAYAMILLMILCSVASVSGDVSHASVRNLLVADEQLNILLLNSYHDGYVWSNDTKAGVKDVFDVHFDNYKMRIEHMDTKNESSDEYLEELFKVYKLKFSDEKFDLIISADDNALKFLLRYSKELFEDTPIFFCGVNTLEAHDLSESTNFYGVVEKSSIASTVDVAIKQNPGVKNIYLVVDDTITGRSTKADVRRDMKAYNSELNLVILEGMTITEIQEKVGSLDSRDSIVIQSFYVVDVDGAVYPLEYSAKLLTEASSVPVYGIYAFGFGNGTVGGKIVEGYSQGTRAAELAAAYISDSTSIREKFIVDDSFNRYKFDYAVMQKYNLSTSVLPEGSIIINKPDNFYERHKGVVNVSLFVVFMLVIYVVALRIQIASQTMKITRTQKELMETEKLASLGRLVAGVAHEINTPVGIGLTLASHIESTTRAVSEMTSCEKISKLEFEEYMDDLRNTSDQLMNTMNRAAELVKSFKRVAVDQISDEHREINLCQYFEEIISSLKNELKRHSVDVRIICKDNLVVWSHAGAIYQIMLNLIMNSMLHGFEDRDDGLIEITALRSSDKKSGRDKILIKYRDYGVGMSQATLEKLYEPFFTTKRGNGGSGLGMNIVFNLVTQKLHGTIECTSAENAGTEFVIELPIEYPSKIIE